MRGLRGLLCEASGHACKLAHLLPLGVLVRRAGRAEHKAQDVPSGQGAVYAVVWPMGQPACGPLLMRASCVHVCVPPSPACSTRAYAGPGHWYLVQRILEPAGMPCIDYKAAAVPHGFGLGHAAGMPSERWAKQLLCAHEVPGGSRREGRLQAVWADSLTINLAARQSMLAVGCMVLRASRLTA